MGMVIIPMVVDYNENGKLCSCLNQNLQNG